MKIKIGKYTNWVGPYQIAYAIFFWCKDDRFNEENMERLEKRWDFRAKNWLSEFLAYGFQKRERSATWRLEDPREMTWFYKLLTWINKKRKRTVKIHIDRWDTWSMDNTLSLIVLPMLEQLKETSHGAPCVDDKDVPKGLGLRSTEAPPKENEWDTDENHFKRWTWVLDEMIWAHRQNTLDDEPDFWIKRPEGARFEPTEDNPKLTVMKWDSKGVYDKKAAKAYQERKRNGFRLFGKYYQNLWD